jgi:hypothetical protein
MERWAIQREGRTGAARKKRRPGDARHGDTRDETTPHECDAQSDPVFDAEP